jgi:hypothetical protein
LSLLYAHIYFPTYAHGRKAMGHYLGCAWSSPEATGRHILVWRAPWEQTNAPALKERLILYTKRDCVALQKVRELLAALPADGAPREAQAGGLRCVEPSKTEEDRPAFGKNRWAVEDFSLINKRAYCDSQRDNRYLRTTPRFKNLERRKQQNKKRYRLRPHHVVTLRAVTGPSCQGSHLARDYTNVHARPS